jgi:hypothetical protein
MAASGAKPSNTRIQRNGYIADVVLSESLISASGYIYHYIIQREGSAEIVTWGQEVSMESALECVNDFMDRRSSKQA